MKLLSTAHVDVGAAVIRSVFATARALFDPGAVVHLGAGTGQGPLHDWRQWPVPASLVLDAQPQRMAWAADWAAQGPERWVVDALVAGADGQAAKLHHASNPDESGLIPTKALQKLWPQLKALEATDIPTRSLDALLAEPAHAALLRAPNLWLVVDFFCTPEFWRGASATLAQARVVVLRQTKTAPKGIEPLQDTADRMAALGYALAATLDSTHPEVVHAVYLRRLDHDLATAHQQEQQLAAAFDGLVQEKAALAAARDAEASAKAEALKQRDALVQEKAALSAARDAEASAKAEALKQRDAEASAKAQALKERDALVQDKTALAAARDAEASAKAEALKRLGQEIDANVLLAKKLEDEIKTSLTLRRVNTDLDTEKAKLQQELSTLISQYDVEVRAKQRALELSELGENNQAELLKKLSEESRQLAALFQEKTKLSEALAVSEEKSNAMEDQVKILEKALAAETHATANAISQRDRESKEKIEALKAKAHLVEVSEDRKQKIENARKEMQIILDDRNNIKEEMQLRLQNELEAQKKKDLEIRSEIERTVHILKVDNDALRTRQAMMHEELLRAEAQIELIKDLLIRGPGL